MQRPSRRTSRQTHRPISGGLRAFACDWPRRYNQAVETQQQQRTIQPVCRIVDLYDQPTDFAYWQSQPPEARLAALEEIRREVHGWNDETQPRLQRVLTIVKR